jgi:hypothetical protein
MTAHRHDADAVNAALPVTLIVYGWRENAPGTLAWVFPSLSAARVAVRAFKNAARWLIVSGRRANDNVDVDEVRRTATVLVERFA